MLLSSCSNRREGRTMPIHLRPERPIAAPISTLSGSQNSGAEHTSNRSDPRLEMPETYTKQRTGTLSNRHKFTHSKFRLRFASPPARAPRPRLRTLAFALPNPAPPPIDLAPSDHHFHSMRGACNSAPAASLGTQISNRHLAPLERDVNIRKQKDPPILIGTNRHNSPTSLPRRSVTAGQRSALTRQPLALCTLPHGRKEREGDVNC
jgi:hypothetical protein